MSPCLRRPSISRLSLVFCALCLILYLLYDFISFESKTERRLTILAQDKLGEIEKLRDSLTDKISAVFESRGQAKDHTREQTERITSKPENEHHEFDEFEEVSTQKPHEQSDDSKSEISDLNELLKHDSKGELSKLIANETLKGKAMRKKFIAYRKAMEYERHLQDSNSTFIAIVNRARYISGLLYNPKIVLLTFICQTCLPFVHSWLCNTKELGLHRFVLFIAKDIETERTLRRTWPEINLISMQFTVSVNQYTQISSNETAYFLCKLQLINSLLHSGISLLLFDVRSVWFENPLQSFPKPSSTKIDMLVNIVPNSHINSGFLVLYPTEKTQNFWKALYFKLRRAERKWRENDSQDPISLENYYEEYLQKMVDTRYEAISARKLPIDSYADGMWYLLPDEERAKTQPVVIRNNYAQGNERKILRAKQWNHWFLQPDGTCHLDLVRKTVKM